MVRAFTMGLGLLATVPAMAQTGLPQVIRPESRPPMAGTAVRPGPDGHYRVQGLVNGVPLTLLFDTGSSAVALRAEDAPRLGIDPASLTYSIISSTANGKVRSAPVRLASLTIGGITRRDVAATVSQPGRLSENLLGQSFLSRLGGYRQEGGRLMLLESR